MQESKEVKRSTGPVRLPSLYISRNTVISLVVIILVIAGSSIFLNRLHGQTENPTISTNGADRWGGDTRITHPTFDFSPPDSQTMTVSPLFAQYYNHHSGATTLGAPLTAAFPTNPGWIQFFAWGALLLPTAQSQHLDSTANPLVKLIGDSVKDQRTGVVHLPLIQALLTAGSLARIGGERSSLTYVDLRKAANPELMQSASSAGQAVFVKGGIRAGGLVGHLIPRAIWNYIQRPAVSPDGWEEDFGAPLTEALAFTVSGQGGVHSMLVQVFLRDGVILDLSSLDATGQPRIQHLLTGADYLRTLGPPAVTLTSQQNGWVQGDTTLLTTPGTGQAAALVGQHFPLQLLGDTAWKSGTLWYHAQWTASGHTETGWVLASSVTLTSPGNVAAWASLGVLSPDLATYLAGFHNRVGVAVYDMTRQRYYTYNTTTQFIMGSSIKVPIMLTLLNTTEREGREPNNSELGLLTTMIENSNNDSAGILYHTETGDAPGVEAYLQKIGVSGLTTYPGAFGWSVTTPLAMVNVLTLLYEGKILTAPDRSLALALMEHIQADQQVGVGDTAPAGATVAMKDGWVIGPDGQWTMNTSGIVMLGQETYIISVYTQDQTFLGDGQAIARHVCQEVASLLI